MSSLKSQGSRLKSAALGLFACFVCLVTCASAQSLNERAQALFERAVSDFRSGRIADSVTGFDELAKLAPAGPDPASEFYAHLYTGLYFDALGDRARAIEHIGTAATRFSSVSGYMGWVARVHLNLLRPGTPRQP